MKRGFPRWGAFSLLTLGVFFLAVSLSLVMPDVAPAGALGDEPSYRLVTPAELKEMLTHKDFVLINVSFRCNGDIPGTDREIPFNLIDRYADTLPPADDARIVLYCNRGYMSRVAAGKLVKMGFHSVYVLKGGLEGWKLSGNEVVKR